MIKKMLFASALLALVASARTASAWQVVEPNGRQILSVHTEYKSGSLYTLAYFISTNEVIYIMSPNSSDVQALRKVLDDAFATGKKIGWIRNRSQPDSPRIGSWFDLDGMPGMPISFYDINAGNEVMIRTK